VSEGKDNTEGNSNGDKGDGQATATRAMVATTTVVGKDEGNGNGDEGQVIKRVRAAWQWQQ
jgi:hypothetical protein